jgi:hypothetical protein
MTTHEAMLAIQEQLDGVEWSAHTLEEIAAILIEAGFRVRDLADETERSQNATLDLPSR